MPSDPRVARCDRRSRSSTDDDRGVATEDDVRRIALALPATTERPSYGTPGFRVKDKLFARMREGHDEEVLVLWTDSEEDKHALIAEAPDTFFTVPHYDGYAAVLVRLAAIDGDELAELLIDAWRTRAPKRLLAELDT